MKNEFKLPMHIVRPDCAGLLKSLPVDEQYETPRDHASSPYFMDNVNSKKYFMSGEYLNEMNELRIFVSMLHFNCLFFPL